MSSTFGVIWTVIGVLLCSQIILITLHCLNARRVARLSRLASLYTKREQAPEKWELRLRELADDVSSLSSSHEKGQRLLMRLNSRAGMRELRGRDAAEEGLPPPSAGKQALRAALGVGGISGRQMQERMRAVQGVPSTDE